MKECHLLASGLGQLLMLSLLLPLLAAAPTVPSTNGTRPKFDSCYGCICEAASRCNRALGCQKGVCGLFQITQPYWLDAGAPTLAGDTAFSQEAFERCTTDPFCALETVHSYMQRFGKDCNKNGEVECHDYALLHYLGPSCEGQPVQQYTEEFENCRFNLVLLNES